MPGPFRQQTRLETIWKQNEGGKYIGPLVLKFVASTRAAPVPKNVPSLKTLTRQMCDEKSTTRLSCHSHSKRRLLQSDDSPMRNMDAFPCAVPLFSCPKDDILKLTKIVANLIQRAIRSVLTEHINGSDRYVSFSDFPREKSALIMQKV